MTTTRGAGSGRGRRDLRVRVKTAKGRKLSSTRWLERQLNDPYVQRAKADGFRGRAAYKIIEIDDKFRFLKPGSRIVDLGCAPGGWCQVAVERVNALGEKRGKAQGRVIGVDLQEVEPIAGAEIPVEWTGPGNRGDFIAIVSKDAENRRIAFYTYTRDESTVKAEVPETAGEAEIRYVTGQDKKTLAAIPIVIQAATAELLEAPDKIAANDKVSVKWNGPNNRRDVICIVPPDAPARQVNNYIYPVNGPDQQIRAPRDPGEYEYRYVTGRDRNILARKKVTVVAE